MAEKAVIGALAVVVIIIVIAGIWEKKIKK